MIKYTKQNNKHYKKACNTIFQINLAHNACSLILKFLKKFLEPHNYINKIHKNQRDMSSLIERVVIQIKSILFAFKYNAGANKHQDAM